MRVTKTQLRRIIKEEKAKLLREESWEDLVDVARGSRRDYHGHTSGRSHDRQGNEYQAAFAELLKSIQEAVQAAITSGINAHDIEAAFNMAHGRARKK